MTKIPNISILLLGFILSGNATISYSDELQKNQCPSLWQAYLKQFFQADGRILDSGVEPNTTSSEAQVYSLFMSLVENDRLTFNIILSWIESNLAHQNLAKNLPSWSWGKRGDGEWAILDQNSASDADLWLAYTLYQAGKLWNEPKYTALAFNILENVKLHEIVNLPGFGQMIIPAPLGFVKNNTWRINPSYLQPQIMQYFQKVDPKGPWKSLMENTIRLYSTFPKGLAPDWVIFERGKGWVYNSPEWSTGSYDAIRTYLWVGMLHPEASSKKQLLKSLSGISLAIEESGKAPPHNVNAYNGKVEIGAPPGFSAALIPYLKSRGELDLLNSQNQIIEANLKNCLVGPNPRYYDQVLSLFGLGWSEGRFSFASDGSLIPFWARPSDD